MRPARSTVDQLPPQTLPPNVVRTLQKIAAETTVGVTVICGFPASGKSTVAQYLSKLTEAILLDKDAFAPDLEEAIMAELTGDPYDRDSASYATVVGPNIYKALVSCSLNVGARLPVIVDAPFIGHVRSAALDSQSLADLIRAKVAAPTPPIRTIWVSSHSESIRQRMVRRGAERDRPKLADWEAYRSEVLESGVDECAAAVVDYLLEN